MSSSLLRVVRVTIPLAATVALTVVLRPRVARIGSTRDERVMLARPRQIDLACHAPADALSIIFEVSIDFTTSPDVDRQRAACNRQGLDPDQELAPLVRRAFQDFATGRFAKHEVRKAAIALGLKPVVDSRCPRKRLTACCAIASTSGRSMLPITAFATRGDFEPLVSEKVFYRVQAILDGRFEITAPRERSGPDFPLRGYVRCETCGKPLTASCAKWRRDFTRTTAARSLLHWSPSTQVPLSECDA
jgi:hypothetical protein